MGTTVWRGSKRIADVGADRGAADDAGAEADGDAGDDEVTGLPTAVGVADPGTDAEPGRAAAVDDALPVAVPMTALAGLAAGEPATGGACDAHG
jgi:hypothetical protein